MRSIAALLALACAVGAQKVPESGYLFTSPKVLQAGTDERACVSLFNLAGPGRQLKLTFLERDVPSDLLQTLDESDFLLFTSETVIPDDVDANGEYCFDVTVPATVTTTSVRVRLQLTASGGVNFTKEAEVSIKPEALLTLVQTDKAKYQPGQKVLFRVITLKHDLTAITDNLEEVWINTPQGTRIAQWRDVETNTGMVQLEMQLTEETPLGSWTIHVKTPQAVVTKSFSVEEYVLPTFEVKVEAPSTLDSSERTITARVCATYTFGKPLIGANITINATASISSYTYDRNPELRRNISDYQLSDDEGCATFDLVVSKIGIGVSRIGSGNTVTLNVLVEEDGTGLKQHETKQVQQQYSSISLLDSDNSQLFLKPGLPYYGQFTLKRRDDTPAANEIITVCYTATYKDRATSSSDQKPKPVPKDILYKATSKLSDHVQEVFGYTPMFWETESQKRRTTKRECREYSTDEKGSIVYYIPPQAEDVDSMDITTSTRVDGDSDSNYRSLRAFFSPSQSYISIDSHLLPQLLPCSGEVTVQVLTSQEENVPAMVYKILSRGRIIKVGHMNTTSLTFPVLPKMGPEFKLLVYYVLESGEVVSDARVFKVDKCFPNQVLVSWGAETVKPGDSASFTVRSAPNSVCGVSAVDRSTELLGTSNQITAETVFSKLDQFVISRFQSPSLVDSDEVYCKALQRELVDTLKSGGATKEDLVKPTQSPAELAQLAASGGGRFPPPPRTPSFRTDRDDALKPFDTAGFLVISNLGLETRPCYKRVEAEEVPEDLLEASLAKGVSALPRPSPPRVQSSTASISGGFAPQQAFLAAGPPAPEFAEDAAFGAAGGDGGASQPDQIREFFPEAFLFSVETLDADGVKVLTSEMPDTITSWVGSAVCTNAKEGFGLSNKTSITTFKPFFTEVSLPYSVKRGEVLNMSASVFNFLDSSLSVYLELAESDQYSLAESSAAAGFDLCLAAGRTEVSYFPLTFSALGEVNITVSVRVKDGNCAEPNAVSPGSDTVIRSVVIKPEGFPQEDTTSRFICLDKGDENHVETVELPLPEGLVPDSERAYFTVIGDLLGPTYRNLQSGLIKSPTGGGEPNMVTLVPNIYVRAYLEEAGLITERQRRQTNNNMKSGYQRQLRYRRSDGSYSSYGAVDREGSLWLTAFVVKAFNEASRYIDIDRDSLDRSVQWILRRQKPDGCFPRVGELIHKELKGGVERGGEAALTAFVMLALKDVASSEQLAGGFACLEDGLLLPNKTLYSEILMAHAYLKMGQDVKGQRLIAKLMEKAEREGDDVLYWKGDRTTILGGSRSVDLEMTSYMVLSLLHISGKGYLEEAARAVRWINQQRNDKGGFVSTQDTVVAVQALTEFASRTFSSELSSQVSVTAGGQAAEISVNPDNRLLVQQEKVVDLQLPASVEFTVSPPGCVVIQTLFRYSSTLQVPDPAFSLGVATKQRGRTTASYQLEVCTSYIRGPGTADRVILEVELPSGYIPVDSTLRSLQQSKAVRRYDSKEGKVTFTLQSVAEDKTCLEFRIVQETEVKELKPSVVKAYEFYRPEERNIVEYELSGPPPAAA